MKKILLVSDASLFSTNGVVRTTNSTKDFLSRQNTVLLITPDDFEHRFCMNKKDKIFWVCPWEYFNLKKKIEAFQPDYIHIVAEGSLGWMTKKWCIYHNKKFTTAFHTLYSDFAWIRYHIPKFLSFCYLRTFHHGSEKILCPSPHIAKILTEKNFSSKPVVVPNGFQKSEFFPPHEKIHHDYPRPLLLFVGRVSPEKNVEAFLSIACAGTKMVVGDGTFVEKLKKNFPNAVFMGEKYSEELRKYYQMADVFVAPSKTDTFGMTIIEALACGTPVAAYAALGSEYIASIVQKGIFVSDDLEKSVKNAVQFANAQEKKENLLDENFSAESVGKQFLEAILV